MANELTLTCTDWKLSQADQREVVTSFTRPSADLAFSNSFPCQGGRPGDEDTGHIASL